MAGLWKLVWIACVLRAACASIQAEHLLSNITLKGRVRATSMWPIDELYSYEYRYEFASISLEGESPCVVAQPRWDLQYASSYNEATSFLDLLVINNILFTLTTDGLNEMVQEADVNLRYKGRKERVPLQGQGISRMRAYHLSQEQLIFFFLNESGYSYSVLSPTEASAVRVLGGVFVSDTQDINIATYRDYFFLSAGQQGVIVYQYNNSTRSLQRVSSLASVGHDIRAVAIKVTHTPDLILALLADYTQGILILPLQVSTMQPTGASLAINCTQVTAILSFSHHAVHTIVATTDRKLAATGIGERIWIQYHLEAGKVIVDEQVSEGLVSRLVHDDYNENYLVQHSEGEVQLAFLRGRSMKWHRESLMKKLHRAALFTGRGLLGEWLLGIEDKGHEILLHKLQYEPRRLVCNGSATSQEFRFRLAGPGTSCPHLQEGCTFVIDVTLQIQVPILGIFPDFQTLAIVVGVLCVAAILLGIIVYRSRKPADLESSTGRRRHRKEDLYSSIFVIALAILLSVGNSVCLIVATPLKLSFSLVERRK